MEIDILLPETRKTFGLLMELMCDPRISPRDRVEVSRASIEALNQHGNVRALFPNLKVALELRNCKRRYRELADKVQQQPRGDTIDKAVEEEMTALRHRITEVGKSIACPDWYDDDQYRRDGEIVTAFEKKRENSPLTESEENEKARAVARQAAYNHRRSQTPEGLASARRAELLMKKITRTISAEENDELQRLRKQFPRRPGPENPSVRALRELIEKRRMGLSSPATGGKNS